MEEALLEVNASSRVKDLNGILCCLVSVEKRIDHRDILRLLGPIDINNTCFISLIANELYFSEV